MNVARFAGLIVSLFVGVIAARAQPDYAPALWNPAYPGHWYTSGNGHQLVVIHDMEGYYETTISYFQQQTQDGNYASVYYCVNGLQNGTDTSGHKENNPGDAAPGEITQMVREQYYAWHAGCWNTWSFGTEHEGFVNNPAWYTEGMYQASAALQKHLCDTAGIPKDRYHIFAHGEWQNPIWTYWMTYNFPQIDTTCNNHTDPGQYWDWNHFMQLITGTNTPPKIGVQPFSRSVDVTSNATFRVSAIGDVPLKYQWRKNNVNIAGATTSTYTLSNAATNGAGSITVVITNNYGMITSSVAALVVNPPRLLQVAFSDNLDANTSTNWNLFQGSQNNVSDFTTNWAFDYTGATYVLNGVTNVIPVAPGTTNGVKRALKITVNKNDAVAANSGVSLYPKSQVFSNDYVLRFDMWINYNGGSGGGSGSTEYPTFGINHTGTRINWGAGTATASDGLWFAVDGEGGAASNYRGYVGNPVNVPTQLSFAAAGFPANGAQSDSVDDPFFQTLFPSPPYETPGMPGKHWIAGEVSQIRGVITLKLNGVVTAQRANATSYTNGDVMIGYMDIFSSIANPPQDNYVLFDNVRVLIGVDPPAITNQPAGTIANIGGKWTFSVGTTGTAPLAYQWKFNNVAIAGATTSAYARTNLQAGDAGNYSVVITNTAGSVSSSIASLAIAQLKINSLSNTAGSWHLSLTGAPGPGYQILTSSNLVDWSTLVTLTNATGTLIYTVPVSTNGTGQFYRISAPQ